MELENVNNENGSMENANVNTQNENIETTQVTEEAENTQKSFTQEDINNIISKRLERERSKWEKDYEEKIEVAKMSAEEKYQHELKKKEEELSIKEKEILTRELKVQAYSILKERDMPSDLVELLNYSSIDELNKSIDVAERVVRAATEKSVNNRLRGVTTPRSSFRQTSGIPSSTDPFLEGLKK